MLQYLWQRIIEETLTPDDIRYGTKEQIRAACLHSAPIGIEIDVAHRLPGSQTTEQQLFTITVNHVDEVGICFVESGSRILRLEQWSCRIQSCELRRFLDNVLVQGYCSNRDSFVPVSLSLLIKMKDGKFDVETSINEI